MLDSTILIKDLLWVILIILAAGVGVLMVVALIKFISILKKVDGIVSENRENINELMTVLPEAVNSINEGVQSVKRTVDNAGDTIGYISDSVAPKAVGILSGADGIIDIVKVIGEIARAAIHYFKKSEE